MKKNREQQRGEKKKGEAKTRTDALLSRGDTKIAYGGLTIGSRSGGIKKN